MEYDYIKCGDCLELMKELPEKCVDVCFTSPPYNDSGTNNMNVSEHTGGNHKKYLFMEKRKDWYEWMCDVIDEMRRITKKYVLFNIQGIKANRKNVYKLIGHYNDVIHDIVIWYKPNGVPTSTPNKLSNSYEYLLIIKSEGVKGVDVNSKFYRNVIIQNNNSNKDYANMHRAVMAKGFSDEIIKEFTKENDIVLDPFFGLGTTAISCIEQNRHYIGYEICKEYFNIAKERINKRKNELIEAKK